MLPGSCIQEKTGVHTAQLHDALDIDKVELSAWCGISFKSVFKGFVEKTIDLCGSFKNGIDVIRFS